MFYKMNRCLNSCVIQRKKNVYIVCFRNQSASADKLRNHISLKSCANTCCRKGKGISINNLNTEFNLVHDWPCLPVLCPCPVTVLST